MARSKIDKILIVLFVLLLILPNVFLNFTATISASENRNLATSPTLFDEEGKINREYLNDWLAWYEDHIGFRNDASGLFLLMRDRIFHEYKDPICFMGKDNNLFFDSNMQYNGYFNYSDEDKQYIAKTLIDFDSYIEELGGKSIYVFIPNKEEVYPELYPDSIVKAEIDPQDALCNYLIDNADVSVLNLSTDMFEKKLIDEDLLYYRIYDPSHWNAKGAFYGYQAIMNCLNAVFNINKKVLDETDFIITQSQFVGINERYDWDGEWLNVFFPYSDKIFNYKIKNPQAILVDDYGLFEERYGYEKGTPYFHYINENCNNKDVLLILGDSYIYSFNLNWFGESFREVYFIGKGTDVDFTRDMIKEIHPNYMIFETVERVTSRSMFDWLKEIMN